ncbi:MAG: ABC transporter ATP-binding protein [Clostridia bacterium]
MTVIKLKNISHTYKNGYVEENALNNISLELEEGKVYAIMGASGSGKTTLLNIIGGIITPTSGEVYIDGVSIVSLNEKMRGLLRLEKVGYIFQSYNLLPFLTVEENIFLPVRLMKKGIKPLLGTYEYLLKELGIAEKKKSYIYELSGGQQQRVSIARCLLAGPKVVLADEPTGNLDSQNAENFMNLLTRTSKKNKITVVLVTHDKEVAKHADKIINIKDGRIQNQIFSEPRETIAVKCNLYNSATS